MFIISAGPHLAFKYLSFGGDFLLLPLTLFNGNFPGYDSFYQYVAQYDENSLMFPFSLFFPDRLGAVSSTLGLMPLVLFFAPVRNFTENKKELACILIFLILLTIFGSHTTRTFIEPFFWASVLFQKK